MDAIVEVVDANQAAINAKGVGFKAFIPAVFARLVNEAFEHRAAGEASIKVTAPVDLVRNRKALPDAWERQVIEFEVPCAWLAERQAVRGRGRYAAATPRFA